MINNVMKTMKILFQKFFQSSNKIIYVSGDGFLTFLEKYKGARRIILVVVIYINMHAFWVSQKLILMGIPLDPEWNYYQLGWLGLLGTFLAFYTMSRVNEFKSNTPWSRPNSWGRENRKTSAEMSEQLPPSTDESEGEGNPPEGV